MSYFLPVYFIPVDRDEVPLRCETWSDVEPLIALRHSKKDSTNLYVSTSRNWWHEDALGQICRGVKVAGLEFISEEIVLLEATQIQDAIDGLENILSLVQEGVPDLGEYEVDHGSVWWLKRASDTREFTKEEFVKAFELSAPVIDAKVEAEMGFGALVGFYTYLKSLKQSLQEAQGQNKLWLYVQPKP